MSSISTAQLIQGCKAGDRRAQKQFFEAYSDAMLTVCKRYLTCPQHAEATMVTGFFKFFTNIRRFVFSGDESIAPWLSRIMINECLMALRTRSPLPVGEEALADRTASPEPTALDTLQAQELHTLIDSLPGGYRIVFNLFAVDGYTHKEIAALLQITEGTSKSQLSKARALLQTRLALQNH